VVSIQIYLIVPAVHAEHNSFIGWTASQVVLELHIEPLHLLPIPAGIMRQPQFFMVFADLLLQAGGRSRAGWITVRGRSFSAAAFPKTPDLNHAGTM